MPLEPNQNATPDTLHYHTVSELFLKLLNANLPKIANPFPIKRLSNKLENSIQTYINYHKTHVMATCFSGIEDTSMEDPDTLDIDNTNQDDLQDENIVQNLLHQTEHLRQAV